MNDETRQALLKELDIGIKKAEAEARKLREFRAWLVDQNASPVATIGDDENVPDRHRPLLYWLDRAFDVLGDDAPARVPDLVKQALDAGWRTDSPNKHVMVRNRLRTLEEMNPPLVEKDGTRWRRLQPLYRNGADRAEVDTS